MKSLYIIRGLPGSGKSHEVQKIVENALRAKRGVIVCSADNYFVNEDGFYEFDPSKLGQAHARSQITALRAMRAKVDLIIVDNTNCQKWEYEIYEEMAEAFDYEVGYKMVGNTDPESVKLYAERNIHGVPLGVIQRMAERFEK